MRTALLAVAPALLAAAACASSPQAPALEEPAHTPGTVRVQGQLTAEGVECQALRADNGTLYTLLGDLKGFKPGDRVVVNGSPVPVSFCQQGTTLQIGEIARPR